jgi:photosystem II stability/assembly factor-like uncharacterized protein
MKKLIYALAVIIISATNLFSQPAWGPQNSGTTDNLYVVYFLNAQTGFAGGDFSIFKTTNGGTSWTPKVLSDSTRIQSIRFLNSTTGYACGGLVNIINWSHQFLFKTTDAGENWTKIYEGQSNSGIYFNDVFPIDTLIYLTSGGWSSFTTTGGMYLSQNSGVNFSTLNLTSSFEAVQKLSFINSQTGWVTSFAGSDVSGGKRKIFKTTNRGQNWTMQFRDSLYLDGMGVNDMDIQFVNQNTGFSIYQRNSNSTRFLKTTNSGISWDSITLPYNKSKAMFFADANTGWIGGSPSPDNISIIRTTNGGTNWPNTWSYNSTTVINSIYFVNNFTGWAVGNGGAIFRTWTSGLPGVNVQNISSEIPSSFSLSQNYPNPFNPNTKIKFELPSVAEPLWRKVYGVSRGVGLVKLNVFDITGREVQTLVNEKLQPGTYETNFDGSNLTSGVYFYKLMTDGFTETRRMVLLK